MIEIDGPLWFAGALLSCGVHMLCLRGHVLYLRSWRDDWRQSLAWRQKYDADAQKRHDEFMRAIGRDDVGALGWNLDGSRERGQA